MRALGKATVLAVGLTLGLAGSAGATITLSGPATTPETCTSPPTPCGATYTITRTAVLDLLDSATVKFTTTPGTATPGADYTNVTKTVTLGPATLLGPSSATVVVPILPDTLNEASETFTATLSEPDGDTLDTSRPASVTTSIVDDDGIPTVTIGAAPTISEGTGTGSTTMAFPVTLSAASGRDVTVHYASIDGTATAGSDYTAITGDLKIPAGQTTGSILVAVAPDGLDEDDETIKMTISAPANAALGAAATQSATGTIADDDPAPTISVTGASLNEGAAGTTTVTNAVVNLSAASGKPVSVAYGTTDGTATVGNGDYKATAGSLTIPAGQRTANIPVTIVGDATPEADETFSMVIASPVNATLADGGSTATITIKNDDGTPPSTSSGTGTTTTGATGTPTTGGTGTSGGVDPNNTGSIGVNDNPTVTKPTKTASTKLKIASPLYSKAKGTLRYTVRCPSGGGRCTGSVTVFTVPMRTSKVKPLRTEQRLGTKKFSIAAGASGTVTVTFTKAGKALVKRGGSVRTKGYAVAKRSGGKLSTATAAKTLSR